MAKSHSSDEIQVINSLQEWEILLLKLYDKSTCKIVNQTTKLCGCHLYATIKLRSNFINQNYTHITTNEHLAQRYTKTFGGLCF